MSRYYPEELKSSLVQKMLPPFNMPVRRIARETGITKTSLYSWKKKALEQGVFVPEVTKNADKWNTEAKFAVVIETAPMNETEISEYCRKKGLYSGQVEEWKKACIQANATSSSRSEALSREHKKDKKTIKDLRRELNRKDKALAETAALLVLAKKARAIWGETEED